MTICPNGGDRRSNGQFEPTDGQRAHGRRLILRACAHDEGQNKRAVVFGGAWTQSGPHLTCMHSAAPRNAPQRVELCTSFVSATE